MPIETQHYRASIGNFVFVFWAFMTSRAKKAAFHLFRTIKLPVSLRPSDLILIFLSTALLLRAGDIEQNPGPVTEMERLSQQVQSVQMSTNHHAASRDMTEIKQQLMWVTRSVQENANDIKTLHERLVQSEQWVEMLQLELDRVQSDLRRNNLKLMGLREENGETSSELVKKVVDFLNTNIDDLSLQYNDVKDAVRVGRQRSDANRPIIVSFKRHEDLMAMMSNTDGRRSMARASGVRVGPDLTPSQRRETQRLRAEGKRWYLKNGRVMPIDSSRRSQRSNAPDDRERNVLRTGDDEESRVVQRTRNDTEEMEVNGRVVACSAASIESQVYNATAPMLERFEDVAEAPEVSSPIAACPVGRMENTRPEMVAMGVRSNVCSSDNASTTPLRGYGRGSPVGSEGSGDSRGPSLLGRASRPLGSRQGPRAHQSQQFSPKQLRSTVQSMPRQRPGELNSQWKKLFSKDDTTAIADLGGAGDTVDKARQ